MSSSQKNPSASATTDSVEKTDLQPQSPVPAGDVRFGVLLFLCLAATVAYIARNSIAVAESTMRGQLDLTKEQMGWIMSGFFLTYSLGQIPAGWFAQRVGSRKAISLFSLVWSAATVGMALMSGWISLLSMRLINGAAQAGLFPACTNTVSKWFPPHRRAMPSGALTSFMSAGGALGALITGVLVVGIGWRWTFAVYSLPGFLWAIAFYLWFRDHPREHPSVSAAELDYITSKPKAKAPSPREPVPTGTEAPEPLESEKPEQLLDATAATDSTAADHEPTPWLALVTSPAMWWICTQQFFRAASYIFFASWFATYLQEGRGVTIVGSGFLTMLPLLAIVLGGFSGGVVSDWVYERTGSLQLARRGVASGTLLICALATLGALLVTDPVGAVLLISLGSFFSAVAGPCSYTITIDMGGRHIATVHSTMNMCGNFGALLFPLVVPRLLAVTGSWDAVLIVFGGMYLVAAVCWLMLDTRGTVFDQALVKMKTS